MSPLGDVLTLAVELLLGVLGFAGLAGLVMDMQDMRVKPRETLTDRWRKLTEELPKCL